MAQDILKRMILFCKVAVEVYFKKPLNGVISDFFFPHYSCVNSCNFLFRTYGIAYLKYTLYNAYVVLSRDTYK